MTKRERFQFLLIWLVLGLLPLFLRPLWEPDEGRYAEIPREMLTSGDWLTPTLNHVLYFEKPPLQYWLSAVSMRLFGTTAWAARLPLALATGLAMWAAYRLAKRLGAGMPLWAAFMTATLLLGYICGQVLTLDALFSAFFVLTLAAVAEAVAARVEARNALGWTLLAFGSLGLALMTKGLAAPVLVGGILLCALPVAWREVPLRRAILRTFLDPGGWLLLLALTVPWFDAVERANPGHARFFFIHEHFARYTSTVHARKGNPLYFVAILGLGLLPWLSASMVGLTRGLRFLRRRGPQGTSGPLLRWTVALLVAGVLVPFVFFSLSGSKLPFYIVPVLVPLAALAAAFEEHAEAWKALARSGTELLVFGVVLLVGLPLAQKTDGPQDPGALAWMLGLGFAFALLGLWARSRRGLTGPRFMVALAAVLLLLTLGAQRLEGRRYDVGHLVAQAPSNAQWISHGNYFQGIAFATGRRVTVINGTGELAFGKERLGTPERERWFQEDPRTLTDVAERLRSEAPGNPVWAVLDRESWKVLPEELRSRWEVVDRTPKAWLARYR
jgi:4-amino-4-deoxy-L-arabinose transferase-like glycosyltransferase